MLLAYKIQNTVLRPLTAGFMQCATHAALLTLIF